MKDLHKLKQFKTMKQKILKFTGIFLMFGVLQLSAGDLSGNTRVISDADNPVTLQQMQVTGTITDEKGDPMQGVSIVVEGTTIGAISNADGYYTINVPDQSAVLAFSFVGYLTKKVEVGSQTVININLELDVLGLEEVVVIGYGTVKKSDLTGSVASIDAEEMNVAPLQSLDQGLAGRSSGVMVTQTSGAPGAVASIRIRGTNSREDGKGSAGWL
jgi:hypothetical protein